MRGPGAPLQTCPWEELPVHLWGRLRADGLARWQAPRKHQLRPVRTGRWPWGGAWLFPQGLWGFKQGIGTTRFVF